jgi:hypothetical protein
MSRRKGRPRKDGPRYRNGHLKKIRAELVDSPRAIAARMPHRKGLGERALDPRAATELGRMVLLELLTEAQGTAGEVYAHLWRGYVATLDGPRWPWEGQGRGLACAGCPTPQDQKFCLCGLKRRIYAEAANVLLSTGSGVPAVVHAVVICDRVCPAGSLPDLKRGLSALAQRFGLAGSGKRGYSRKSSSQNVAPVTP